MRFRHLRNKDAVRTIWDKLDDCAGIQRMPGICPLMAGHINWDATEDDCYGPVREYAQQKGIRIGTVHPNTFIDKGFGSVCGSTKMSGKRRF